MNCHPGERPAAADRSRCSRISRWWCAARTAWRAGHALHHLPRHRRELRSGARARPSAMASRAGLDGLAGQDARRRSASRSRTRRATAARTWPRSCIIQPRTAGRLGLEPRRGPHARAGHAEGVRRADQGLGRYRRALPGLGQAARSSVSDTSRCSTTVRARVFDDWFGYFRLCFASFLRGQVSASPQAPTQSKSNHHFCAVSPSLGRHVQIVFRARDRSGGIAKK